MSVKVIFTAAGDVTQGVAQLDTGVCCKVQVKDAHLLLVLYKVS